jgi:hypothetical protein
MTLYVRSQGDPAQMVNPVGREISAAGPQVLVSGIRTGQQVVDGCELPGEAEQLAHGGGIQDHVTAEELDAARVGDEQRRQHPDKRGLPGPVGPE